LDARELLKGEKQDPGLIYYAISAATTVLPTL